jgi:hypothetical protein
MIKLTVKVVLKKEINQIKLKISKISIIHQKTIDGKFKPRDRTLWKSCVYPMLIYRQYQVIICEYIRKKSYRKEIPY